MSRIEASSQIHVLSPPLAAGLRRGAVSRVLSGAKSARWRPGLATGCRHAEVFAPAGEASGAALALALARDALGTDAEDQRPWLWVQDKAALRLSGRPYRPGLPPHLRHRLIHVAAATPEDALFALEEGLRCRDLAFVIGEIAGNPRSLDFTASRRLSLAAEKHGTALWLVRLDARADLGSARMRWRVAAAASPPPRWNPQAPGRATWGAELFRAHTFQPGHWTLRDDDTALAAEPAGSGTPDHGDLVRGPGARSLAAG
jgi:protein ImuA